MNDNAQDSPRQYLEMIRKALDAYAERGWCALPADAVRKHPAVPWRQYQHHRPGQEEALALFRRAWRRLNTHLGIGLVTGRVSGLLVLDLDSSKDGKPAGWESLASKLADMPPGPTVLTPSGGRHYYFQLPPGAIPPRNAAGKLPSVDWRGEGGWVVAPPPRRPGGGGEYAWAPDLGPDTPLPDCPDWLVAMIREQGSTHGSEHGAGHNPADWQAAAVAALGQEGARNDACARLAGWFARKKFPEEAATALLQAASTLPPEEVATTVASIYAGHARRHLTTADRVREALAYWRAGRLPRAEAAMVLAECGFLADEIKMLLNGGANNDQEE